VSTTSVSVSAKGQRRYTGRIANTVYSAVLLLMLYDWPHQVYRKLGPRMSLDSDRSRLIAQQFDDYAQRLRMVVKPTFVLGSVPASAGAFSGNAVVVISPDMLDPAKFSDNDVRFILAHELGHIARLDAYRFWTRWTNQAAEVRELDADRIAVRLVGCAAMREAVLHHWAEFMKGYWEDGDHHPHPAERLHQVCGTFAREST
jgi:Zn-dependent protease with chaperone function